MAINNAKHIVTEIDAVRCTVVESKIEADRAAFLRDILELNGYEVKELKENDDSGATKYTIGVTDLLFNPVFAIYERQLKTADGRFITPAYWKQESTETDSRYWLRRTK
jgi:hypothetical protein